MSGVRGYTQDSSGGTVYLLTDLTVGAAGPGGTVVIGAQQSHGDSGRSYVFGK